MLKIQCIAFEISYERFIGKSLCESVLIVIINILYINKNIILIVIIVETFC